MSPLARDRLALLAAAFLFSTGGTVIKLSGWNGFQVAAGRSLIAAVVLFALVPRWRRLAEPRALLVGAAYAATLTLFVVANKLTTAANAIFLQSTAPLYVLFLAPWLLGERSRGRDGPALAGSAVIAGNALAFAACLPLLGGLPRWTPADLGAVAYLGVFQVALAYVFMNRGIAGVPALEASLLLLLEPVLAALIAAWIHGEAPGPWALAGCGLILATTAARTLLAARTRASPG